MIKSWVQKQSFPCQSTLIIKSTSFGVIIVIWFHRDSSKREYFVVISPGRHRHINNRLHRQSNVWSYSHMFKIPVNRLPHSRGEGTRFTTHSRFLNLHTKPSIFMLEVNQEQKKFCLLKFWITWKISDQPWRFQYFLTSSSGIRVVQ
jgi:hypothetical protein